MSKSSIVCDEGENDDLWGVEVETNGMGSRLEIEVCVSTFSALKYFWFCVV